MSFNFSVRDFDDYVNQRVINKAPLVDSINSVGLENAGESKYVSKSKLNESNNGDLIFDVSEPEQYKLQLKIREAFGRQNNINVTGIADHPDFTQLIYGGQINHYITTMFIDIKGSTKLSLKYPNSLEFIYKFKNAVIRSCIEVIHAFDGCVHRIMGDAVLGFFGSTRLGVSRPQSILDCLNAAAMLTVVLEQAIKPWLLEQHSDFDVRDFGFRVGCNFGDCEEVLWANYGFGLIGEVSPTGLPVDLAAKLQGLASKNQVMMGEGLLNYFNFPHDFCSIKQIQENKENVDKPYIYPNYKKADGTDLNYIMRSLETHKYILGLPLPLNMKKLVATKVNINEQVVPNNNFVLSAMITSPKNSVQEYYSNSKIVEKDSKIKITLKGENIRLDQRFKVIFYKKNNSGFNDEEILKKHLEEEVITQNLESAANHNINYFFSYAHFERDCNFKGLHYIKCEVKNSDGNVIFRDYIYVPIE